MKLSTELLECSIIELLASVGDDNIREPESVNDRLLKKVFDFAHNVHQGFYLHPFAEVIDGNNEKLLLTDC